MKCLSRKEEKRLCYAVPKITCIHTFYVVLQNCNRKCCFLEFFGGFSLQKYNRKCGFLESGVWRQESWSNLWPATANEYESCQNDFANLLVLVPYFPPLRQRTVLSKKGSGLFDLLHLNCAKILQICKFAFPEHCVDGLPGIDEDLPPVRLSKLLKRLK